MQVAALPTEMQSLAGGLLKRGYDLWLIGSRANPTKKPPNDWDILVFGDPTLLKEMESIQPIDGLDVLVVVDGDHFESPWLRVPDNVKKEGSLARWKWQLTGGDTATYQGTKSPDDWGTPKRGLRIVS